MNRHFLSGSRITLFVMIGIVSVFALEMPPFFYSELSAQEEPGTLPKEMVMACTESPENFMGKWFYLSYREAFRRLGITLVYRYYPPKRASSLADQGLIDGELGRIYSYGDAHPNLIRVDRDVFRTRIVAFASNPDLRLDGWNSLKGTMYTVRYMHGVKACEDNLPQVVDSENLGRSMTVEDGLRVLTGRNEDLYIDEELSVLSELKNNIAFKDAEVYVAGVMEELYLYAFLHNRHRPLVSKLSGVLGKMKQEGLIEKFRKVAMGQIDQTVTPGQEESVP